MRILAWLFRAAVFFALFAFALNNNDPARIKWFFGYEWSAPMIFIVLAAFAFGCAFGVLAMVPSWWRHRRVARQQRNVALVVKADPAVAPTPSAPMPLPDGVPREAL